MPEKLKIVFGTIVGVIIGPATSGLLLVLLSIIISPLWLFLMSDLPEPWMNIQEITGYTVGIIELVLIVLSGVLGGWLGWQWSKGLSLKLSIKNLGSRVAKIWQNFKLPLVIISTIVILAILGLDALIVLKSKRSIPPTTSLPIPTISPPIFPTSTPSLQKITLTTDKTEYEQGETVKITVKNNTEEEKGICGPFYTVENFDGGKWIEIKKVLCPCEVVCRLAAYLVLKPNKLMEYEWKQKEEWCSDPSRISTTISNQVLPGRYRVKSYIGAMKGECKEIYSNEFRIKEKEVDTSKIGSMLETIMDYIKHNHPDAAVLAEEDMSWTKSDMDIRPGYSRYVYTSDDWTVTIGYAMTLERAYDVRAEYTERIVWTGTIKDDVVSEESYLQK